MLFALPDELLEHLVATVLARPANNAAVFAAAQQAAEEADAAHTKIVQNIAAGSAGIRGTSFG